jgi:hypothetical protein
MELLKKQPLYCAPSWSWASVNGRIALLPLNGLATAGLSNETMFARATVEKAQVFYQRRPVSEARSLVDSGYLSITGPAAEGFPSEDTKANCLLYLSVGRLGRRSRIGRGKPLQFVPDNDSPQPPGSGILAMHIMSVHHSETTQKHYGLVLRSKQAASAPSGVRAVYQRVRLWWTMTPRAQGAASKASGSSDMFSTWLTRSVTVT